MSYYTNFGHASFQRLALIARSTKKCPNDAASFIEEGLARRELSDDHAFYTPDDHDKLTVALGWAQETLRFHDSDEKEHGYTK